MLSGNRNFEGRINQDVKANYLASPPLVVAYALAGRMDLDLTSEPLGEGSDGEPVYLRDIWPDAAEIKELVGRSIASEMFTRNYGEVLEGDETWNAVEVPEGDRYTWPDSTYVRRPSFFEGMPAEAPGVEPIDGARVLALLGDSITTDHISPAGAIKKDSPAGQWLIEQGVEPRDFNSYGSRRGNHEVMIRGTFANIRLRNLLVERAGGFTRHFPDGEETTIYEAAMAYAEEGVPLVVLAGKEYGSGSSRDWAAKGTKLLGVRAVIAESFERIHRSNLIGMGVLPLQFPAGESVESLGLTGEEIFDVGDLEDGEAKTVDGHARREGADPSRVRGDRSPRHPERGRLLPQRRHPADGSAEPAGVGATAGKAVQEGRGRQGGPRDPHCTCASVAREGCRRGRSPERDCSEEQSASTYTALDALGSRLLSGSTAIPQLSCGESAMPHPRRSISSIPITLPTGPTGVSVAASRV